MAQLQARLPIADPVRIPAPQGAGLSWLEIDLRRLEGNVRAIREVLDAGAGARSGGREPVRLCPVLKKDAYGLGAVPIAHRLSKAGVEMFAVYSPGEAEHLVTHAVTTPILVLMPMRRLNRTDALYRHAVAERLHLSIHDSSQLDEVNIIGQRLGIKLPCHLYIDTGMSRSGLCPSQALDLLRSAATHRYVRIAGVFTHLATSGSNPAFAAEQVATFNTLLQDAAGSLPDDVIRHVANSTGLLRDAGWHLDMVRPGIGVYGYGPEVADMSQGGWVGHPPALRPVLRWCSRVIHAQRYPEGAPVSYDSTHTLKRESVLGIVPVGHGDGYPIGLSNKATVRVGDTDCRVLGQVSMDQIVIDLTDVPDAGEQDLAGLRDMPVELYSPDPGAPHALPRLAKLAGTSIFEMLCRLSPKLTRRYVRE